MTRVLLQWGSIGAGCLGLIALGMVPAVLCAWLFMVIWNAIVPGFGGPAVSFWISLGAWLLLAMLFGGSVGARKRR